MASLIPKPHLHKQRSGNETVSEPFSLLFLQYLVEGELGGEENWKCPKDEYFVIENVSLGAANYPERRSHAQTARCGHVTGLIIMMSSLLLQYYEPGGHSECSNTTAEVGRVTEYVYSWHVYDDFLSRAAQQQVHE